MQLLNLFAYGTYPDYIGELVMILLNLAFSFFLTVIAALECLGTKLRTSSTYGIPCTLVGCIPYPKDYYLFGANKVGNVRVGGVVYGCWNFGNGNFVAS